MQAQHYKYVLLFQHEWVCHQFYQILQILSSRVSSYVR